MVEAGIELARVSSYKELLAALVARRHDIGLPQTEVEEIAGLHHGYVGKLECGTKRFGMMSLGCVLGALGVELVLVATTPHHVAQGRIAPGLPASAILGTGPRKKAA
jgi:hypothetical protein